MFKTIHECGLELVAYTENTHLHLPWGIESSDALPVMAARASFGKQDKTGKNREADVKLMNFLAEHKHMTPFEYQHATFLIEVPLFIRSQIHRHRTFSYNEISRRYTSENLEFWIPDKFRGQSKDNKQASEGVVEVVGGIENWQHYVGVHLGYYESLLEQGVSREIARAMLPQSLLTTFYMGGNLRNWAHFIELRRDPHAQYEVQVVANRIAEILRTMWPESCNALGV